MSDVVSAGKGVRSALLYSLLFFYAGIAGTYQAVNAVSTTIALFNLRNQVQAPFQLYGNVISNATAEAKHAGLAGGDIIVAIENQPFTGEALWQRIRWYARPGDRVSLTVRKQNGTETTTAFSLNGIPQGYSVGDPPNRMPATEALLILFFAIGVPSLCLALGVWVALARPADLNAWFVLILLTYPQIFNAGATRTWVPGWLGLRLFWHNAFLLLTPAALFLLGLLFPGRSRLDKRLPWLKWLVVAFSGLALVATFLSTFNGWYRISLLPRVDTIDRVLNPIVDCFDIFCVVLYWVLLFDNLRTASSAGARRRLQVLLAGSIVGLGSILVIFGLLPFLGAPDPGDILWLDSLAIILMLFFPL